jgi:murein DD-endopeptidase MepM/ murein hydrolase activator NlpD
MNDSIYAFGFDQGEGWDYFDEGKESLRKAFLKSPLKFGRLSSGYSYRRFHPVQKRYKAHLGTDYAAPKGTPIMATGDGVIVEAQYKKYNGRYVKIRHNGTYSTQYLHMSKIESGIKPGVRVKQGQTIGYVGSTGLATGPHVCYRFWKNGSQVNHRREEVPPAEPLKPEYYDEFQMYIDSIRPEIDKIQWNKAVLADNITN